MEQWKKILHKLLFPGAGALFLSVPLSAALLLYTFALSHENEPVAYIAYLLSAYTTAIVCAQIPPLIRKASARIHKNKYAHRYLTDVPFRMQLSLYISLCINLFYAVIKLFFGAYYRSVWFGTLGVYYALLTSMRFLLLRHAKRSPFGKELVRELKHYRLCGAILVPTTIALSGVIVLVITKGEGFEYPGYLIYVAAMYSFYAVITAVLHLIKYKRYQSPVLSAAKAVNLAAALVSILSLETAMLSQFADSGDVAFRQGMVAATGAGICFIVLGMAVYMIVHATKRLKAQAL